MSTREPDARVVACQAQRDTAARAMAVVNSLQTRLFLLQTQLYSATGDQKSAIASQIDEVIDVAQPAAEAALARAEAELLACLGGVRNEPAEMP